MPPKKRNVGGTLVVAGIVVGGTVVTIEAANLCAAPERDGLAPAGVEQCVNVSDHLDAGKHRAGKIRAVAGLQEVPVSPA